MARQPFHIARQTAILTRGGCSRCMALRRHVRDRHALQFDHNCEFAVTTAYSQQPADTTKIGWLVFITTGFVWSKLSLNDLGMACNAAAQLVSGYNRHCNAVAMPARLQPTLEISDTARLFPSQWLSCMY